MHQNNTPRRGEHDGASGQITGAGGGNARAGNALTLLEDAAMGDTGGMDDDEGRLPPSQPCTRANVANAAHSALETTWSTR
ncbi:hypothetical protein [Xanthomonas cannabis]|uniref:hypothetical protein n=1 Tax=Xanthomonas cannabis TaxID=1885674 RepID=UPI001111E58F|nr:hypothetical protein [Xanthomonas cannabis]